MARQQRVSDGEVADNKYLDEVLGDQSVVEDDDEIIDGEGTDDAGDASEEGAGKGKKRTDGTGTDGAGDGKGKPGDGKQLGKDPLAGKQPGKKGDTAKVGDKPTLSQPQLMEVYNVAKARLQPVINKLEMDNRKLTNSLKSYQDRDELFKEYKLNPTEHLNAVRLAVAIKNDPVKAINFLIAQAKAAGHNIEGAGAGTDMSAIQHMIQQAIAPLAREREEQEANAGAMQEAEVELNEFLGDYPDARVHIPALTDLLQRFPDLTLSKAYIRMKDMYHQNGWDFNMPVTQIAAAIKAQQAGGNRQQPRKPIGVKGVSNVIDQQQEDTTDEEPRVADVGTSRKDIIRNAMRQAGYDLDRLN